MPDAQSMIERVARVIGEHYDGYADPVDTPNNWVRAMEATRAVLTAMREPDPSFWRKVTSYGDTAEHNARALWQHMIDAALKDGNA